MTSKLFIIDGSSYFYRAYYAVKHLTTKQGFPTNAILGFVKMLTKVAKEHSPDYLAVVFDSSRKSFRNDIFADYKANREAMPDDLRKQVPYISEVVDAFNIAQLRAEGYEADDIIGTLVKNFGAQPETEIYIVTGDKDMNQLVGKNTYVLDTMKNICYDAAEVKKKYGINVDQIVDYFSLTGDTSDNVPGVRGIGPKTAEKLLTEFGSLENILVNIDKIQPDRVRELIRASKDNALMSKKLITLDMNVPLDITLDKLKTPVEPNRSKLVRLFTELEFLSLLKDVSPAKTISYDGYEIVYKCSRLKELLDELKSAGTTVAVDTETTSLDTTIAKLVGLSFCGREGKAYYVPVGHLYLGVRNIDDVEHALVMLKEFLEDESVPKAAHNLKYDYMALLRHNIRPAGLKDDTMLASYLLNPNRRSHSLDYLANEFFQHSTILYSDITGKGKQQSTFDSVEVEKAGEYSCEDVDVTLRLHNKLTPALETDKLDKLYRDVEVPLAFVLAEMEMTGVSVDRSYLRELSAYFESKIKQLETSIYSEAGERFNIDSTKQLQHILFEKLKLPSGRKTKTGYSTDAGQLEELASNHNIAKLLLNYRHIAKLKNTYSDALPQLINPGTGRIHTSYNQTVTVTGRLSSSAPNLQNIPIKTEEGRKIRRAFIGSNERLLLSADYSQIELRVLAELSGESALIEAFKNGEDVHKRTAVEIFGVSKELVSDEMRRQAKTINFGLIYGMSAFGLAKQIGVSNTVAAHYMKNYFDRYSKVKTYFDTVIANAKKNGYVSTLFGRRRYVYEINSSNSQVQKNAERAAINMPVQGTAADMIKIAMIRIAKKLVEMRLQSKMIMQVHDEVVLEAPEGEFKEVTHLVRYEMENAIEMTVPLVVDLKAGRNWDEMDDLSNKKNKKL